MILGTWRDETVTFANASDRWNDMAVERAEDPIERVRLSGYAVLMHDLLMYAREPLNRDYLRMLYRAEGLIYTGR